MRRALTNFYCVFLFSVLICLLSLGLSVWLNDVEWFQASGAVVTVGGVLLAARKIIRLGLEEFLRDESTIDGGHIDPTPEEIVHTAVGVTTLGGSTGQRAQRMKMFVEPPVIYLHKAPVDFRQSINGLSAIIESEMALSPFSGVLQSPAR